MHAQINWLIGVIALFIASYGLTGTIRRYALQKGILDVPNARSSHAVPTPRGGGLAVVIVFLAALLLLAMRSVIVLDLAVAICGGGLLVAGIGWVDDRRGVSPLVRAVVHGLASSWALYWLGGFPSLNLGMTRLVLGPVGFILGVVGIVWCINLYNFMDGIDGLAGTEAVTTGLIAALLVGGAGVGFLPSLSDVATASARESIAVVSLLLVPASLGFIVWNWPPAKVFMGDVGSGFLGFTFGVLAVASENSGALPLLVWLLLLGVFVVDATATLLGRIWRRERLTEPHRTHAYQLAVQTGYTHKQVTMTVLAINAMLGVLAAAALVWPRALLPAVIAGGLALVILRAGVVRAYWMRRGPQQRVVARQHRPGSESRSV